MSHSFLQKFIFDKLPIRGAYVVLDDVWQTISKQKEYPDGIRRVLGEMLIANILLTSHLKLNGKMITQIQDNPKLDLVVSECNNLFDVRATAKFSTSAHADNQVSYADCLANGSLVISIDSERDGKVYQSVVALSGLDVSAMIEEYMLQSEQLKSMFMITYAENKIVAFMLQQLPDHAGVYADDIERIFMLANTLSRQELTHDSLELLLNKLFEDDIVIFDAYPINFRCSCSREKVSNMLRSLGKEEAHSIIKEQGSIEVTCDFCNTVYKFNTADVDMIFSNIAIDMETISNAIH